MGLFKSIFTWWEGPTIGTRLWSARNGEMVGRDAEGNRYFRKAAKNGARERRWVIYEGENESSRVPPEWHGWLHRSHDMIPDPDAERKPWIRAHSANLTGSKDAYLRPGALPTGRQRPKTTGDYEAWSPDGDVASVTAEKAAS